MNFVTSSNEKIIIIIFKKLSNESQIFFSTFSISNERSRFSNSFLSKEAGENLLHWNNSSTLRTLRIYPSGSDKNSLRARSLLSSVGQVFIYSLQRGDIQCGIRQRDGWTYFHRIRETLPSSFANTINVMWNVNRVAVSFISFLCRPRNSRGDRKKSSIGDSL